MIKIYDIYEKVILQVEVTSEAKREEEMSKSDFISLSFRLCDKIILPVGAYIEYTYKIDKVRSVTRRFSLLEPYEPTQVNETSWKYTPEFQHPKMLLSKIPFYILTNNSKGETIKQTSWAFNGSPLGIMDKVCKFLNKEIGFADKGWAKSVTTTVANTINVSFTDVDIISALTAISNAVGNNCEWHIDYDNEIIYLGNISIGEIPTILNVGDNVCAPSTSLNNEKYYNTCKHISTWEAKLLVFGNGIDSKTWTLPYDIEMVVTYDIIYRNADYCVGCSENGGQELREHWASKEGGNSAVRVYPGIYAPRTVRMKFPQGSKANTSITKEPVDYWDGMTEDHLTIEYYVNGQKISDDSITIDDVSYSFNGSWN